MDDFAHRVENFHEKLAASQSHSSRRYKLTGRPQSAAQPRNSRHEEPLAGVSNVQHPARYGVRVRQKSAGSLMDWLEGSLNATEKPELGAQPAA